MEALELKLLMSPDVVGIEAGGGPADVESFCVLVQCLIGEPGPAADTFDVIVASPDRFAAAVPTDGGALSGRGYLVMRRWDGARVRETIAGWVAEASGAADWPAAAAILCRSMFWELENDDIG